MDIYADMFEYWNNALKVLWSQESRTVPGLKFVFQGPLCSSRGFAGRCATRDVTTQGDWLATEGVEGVVGIGAAG